MTIGKAIKIQRKWKKDMWVAFSELYELYLILFSLCRRNRILKKLCKKCKTNVRLSLFKTFKIKPEIVAW